MEKAGIKEKIKSFVLGRRWIKPLIVIVVVIILLKVVGAKLSGRKTDQTEQVRTATASVRDISKTLEATGIIAPLNQYDVTSLVQGEVTECTFEEGDLVKKDDVLYRISTDNIDKTIKNSRTAMKRARKNYQDAKKDLNDMKIRANASGYIRKLYVEPGDTVQAGSKVADIYDNTNMDLEVPFSVGDAGAGWVGKSATVIMEQTGDRMKGTVTKVSSVTNVLPGNRVVCPVTIRVKNPGGISAGDTATAKISGVMCSAAGSFSVREETELMASKSGDIDVISVKEGGYVKKNQTILTLESDEMEKQVRSAKEQYEDAREQYRDQIDSLDDYTIKAPIGGEIIVKNIKVGDNISMNNGGATVLATIYDLSAVTFDMSIDEMDVLNIREKMKVTVTADALEDETYSGYVQNISLESSATGGVTQYPVTVKIDQIGNLLPGMNVTGLIELERAEQVLAVPSSALQRGNVVYVKDSESAPADPGDARNTDNTGNTGSVGGNPEQDGRTPGQHAPGADGTGERQLPGQGESGNPAQGETGKSAQGETGNPAQGETEKPAQGETGNPAQGETGNPAQDESDAESRSGAGNRNIPDGFHAVEVETGLDNGDYIEITSGLKEGDTVYIPTVETTNDNMMMFGMNGQQPMGGQPGMNGMQGGNRQNRQYGGGAPGGPGR